MKLFVGIDVSSEKLDVCFLNSYDTTLKEITFSNDVNGTQTIKQDVLHFHETLEWSQPLSTAFILLPFYMREPL